MWYWDMNMIRPDRNTFWWIRSFNTEPVFVIKCATVNHQLWNVCRVEFGIGVMDDEVKQTMDTLLDVCRMRYADELVNKGERK